MVLDPIPQSLPVHFFGSRPQPPTSPCNEFVHPKNCFTNYCGFFFGVPKKYSLTLPRFLTCDSARVCCFWMHNQRVCAFKNNNPGRITTDKSNLGIFRMQNRMYIGQKVYRCIGQNLLSNRNNNTCIFKSLLYIYIYMCICKSAYVDIYIHVHICIYIYINIFVYIHIQIYVYICVCVYSKESKQNFLFV